SGAYGSGCILAHIPHKFPFFNKSRSDHMPTDSDVPVALLSLWAPETEQLIFLHEMEIARVLLDVKRRQKLSSTFRNEPEAIEKSNLIARRGARGLIRAPRFEFRGGKSGQINFSLE